MPATDREFARFALASHHVLRIAEYQSPVLEDPAPEALTDVGVSRQVENDVTTR